MLAPTQLRVLSGLLEQGLELAPPQREDWLASLQGDDAALGPTLRRLLARHAAKETSDLLDRGPVFSGTDATDGLQVGGTVGPYRLQRELGSGGMGAVWLAERSDGSLKRKVALKLPHLSWAPGLVARFEREREILSGLEHPHIARLYDAGVDDGGRLYMALEYVEGEPLDAYCRQRGLPVAERLRLLLQVAGAVAYAHGRLVLHRDLKPGNILVTAGGEVRLLDFGIAKLMQGDSASETALTQASGRALTLDYASPEQIRGDAIGTASDVYSLGVVAFELLAGARPYRLKRGSAAELEEAITGQDLPLASSVAADPMAKKALRGDLDAILAQALRKDALARYASVDAFAQDIERHLRGEAVLARPDRGAYRLRRFIARNRLAVGAAGAVLMAVLSGAAVALWQARVAIEQARMAQEQGEMARRSARQAQAVQAFLLDIFRRNSHQQADPMKARATTARELLDIGTAQVGDALKDVPEAQLEVISVLTDMYTQLSLNGEAAALRRRGLDTARRAFAADDVRLADALISFADTLHTGDRRAEIPSLLQEARAILDRAGEKTSFLRGALLYQTARFQRDQSLPAARASADELVAFFRAHHPARPTLINGLTLAARARIFAFDGAAAEPLLNEALELARGRHGAAAAWMVGPAGHLADAQWAQWKVDEAERSARLSLSLSLRVNGERHAETLRSAARLAALLMFTGRSAEGEALAAGVHGRMADAQSRLSSDTLANLRGVLAHARHELGLPAEAEPAVQDDVADLRVKLPDSGAMASGLVKLADIVAARGRHDEAAALLREGEARWLKFAGTPTPVGVTQAIALAKARLALARGEAQAALDLLSAIAPPAASVGAITAHAAPAGGIARLAVLADIARADAARTVGRPDEALRAAERAVVALQAVPNHRLPLVEGQALVALGRAQAALGRAAEASVTLNAAVTLLQTQGHPASLWLADARFALGELLARSDGVRARPLLVAARSARAVQTAIGTPGRTPSAAVVGAR